MTENNVETEYLELNRKDAWVVAYQAVHKEALRIEVEEQMTLNEARKPQNRKLNRYRDVNPYDHSRIILKRGSTDYINANLVKMPAANRQYILTQGPLPDTVGHFWLMVWEQNSRAVLMLNKIVEKKQIKCHRYWPEDIGENYNMNLTDVGLSLQYLSHEDYSYFSKRIFRLTDTENKTSREIIQYHYTTWPDFGVPSSPRDFLEFLYKVRSSGALEENVGPAVIHCSAGIGRSGTFCLVDCCLVLIERNGQNAVNVQNILIGLRRYRTGLIQTPDQLRFSYQAIIEGARKLRGQDSNYNDYEEVPISSSCPRRNCEKEEEDDEEPPPLPPPRGESLGRCGPPQVTGQTISNAPSTRELTAKFLTEIADDKFNVKDIDNELLTSESMQKSVDFSRPLPKIPNSESLDEFQSNYEYNDFYGNKISTNGEDEKHDSSNDISEASVSEKSDVVSLSEDSNWGKINLQVDINTINAENIANLTRNVFKDEICPISKPLPPIPNNESEKVNGIEKIVLGSRQAENVQFNTEEQSLSKTEKDMFNQISSNKIISEKENNINLTTETEQIINQLSSSESAAVRRRQRSEKQTLLAEKVREIKRKQQDNERKQQSKRLLLPLGLGLDPGAAND